MGNARRIYHWVARIAVVNDRNDRKVCILWHCRGVKVPERCDTGEWFQLIDVHDLRTWGRARGRDITAVHGGRRDHSAVVEVHRILLHGHAGFLRRIDRNAERNSHEGRVVGVIEVSMPEKDGFRTKTNQIFHNQRRSTRYSLRSMDIRIQQDHPSLERHGVGRIREPGEDDFVIPYASRVRIDILGAEEELASPDQVRVGFSTLGACTDGKQKREHQGAKDNRVGPFHVIPPFGQDHLILMPSQDDVYGLEDALYSQVVKYFFLMTGISFSYVDSFAPVWRADHFFRRGD